MPEQTISPGVFTEERDQTSLQQGVQDIGGAFVGPTQKGPAFEPVEVSSPQEYEQRFGNDGLYMDYSATNYLTDASSATVVRLLGEEGYEAEGVEIQLPEGELSTKAFQITKAEFSFDQDIGPNEEVDVRVCFRGRQRRTSEQQVLDYELTIHEYCDGEYNGQVLNEQNVNLDCFDGTFEPNANQFASVYYEVVAELDNGRTVEIESPTAQVQGFYLENIDYNWASGENKGEQEIVSLAGDVENIQGKYDIEVYEVVNGNLREDPVAERTGITDKRFRAAWVHKASEGDRVTYVVKGTSGEVEDVPDEVSPPIDVISREPTPQFKLYSVNWNLEEDEKVDNRQKLQVDAEASQQVNAEGIDVVKSGQSTDLNRSGTEIVDGEVQDTSIYLEFKVGDGGINISTGDVVEYVLNIVEEGSQSSNSLTTTSPEVEIDGGVFRIGEVKEAFNSGDTVGPEQKSPVLFEVENENGPRTDFNYTVYEVINGNEQSTPIINETTSTEPEVALGLVGTGTAGINDTLQFRIDVTQTSTQSGSIESTDSYTTSPQTIRNLDPTGQSEIAIQDTRFGFESGVFEAGEALFGGFSVDVGSGTNYSQRMELYVDGEATGSLASIPSVSDPDRYFFEFDVPSSGIYDGDEFFYRIEVEDEDGNITDTVDTPTLVFSGQENPDFGIQDVEFQFDDGDEPDLNERLSAQFETRRTSWTPSGDKLGLRYRVIGYVNGSPVENVVTDTVSETGNATVLQGDQGPISEGGPQENFEAAWYLGENTMVSTGDEVQYELVVEQYDIGTETVIDTKTQMGNKVTVSERVPKADITLAALAPTQRLRADADRVLDAQINPDDADITNFELILGLESETNGENTDDGEQLDAKNTDNPVERLLSESDNDQMMQSEDGLIDGESYKVSLQEGDSNYLLDLFGRNVESPTEMFAKNSFPEVWRELIEEHYGETGIDLKASYDPAKYDFDGEGFDNASTPWIVSQDQQPDQPGASRRRLFQLETMGDGNYSNTEIKATVSNVRYPSEVPGSEYGEFDILVRELGDDDTDVTILESFSGVNLNPDSQNYIGRVIGNRKTEVNDQGKFVEKGGEAGVFENRSNYIRVVVNPEVVRANIGGRNDLSSLVPWGFEPFQLPFDYDGQVPHGLKPRLVRAAGDMEHDILPEEGINPDLTTASAPFDSRIAFGVDLNWEGNLSWLNPIAANADTSSEQAEFEQDFGFVLSDAYVQSPSGDGLRQIEYGDGKAEGVSQSARKFTVAFQGGFDGMDPAKPQALEEKITSQNVQGLDLSEPDADGTLAYQKAIRLLGNEDLFDINLLVTPGVINSLHGAVVSDAIDMVESRADTFYVFDAAGVDASVADATASIESVDTSYAATYYPWMRIRDQDRNKQVRVPPTVLIPRVYAFNDQTAAEWFAPAGFERGGIPEAVSAVVRLRREDRDDLYKNRVNPIAQFPGQGVSVWGQKTLQTQASALDRVNVRRLLIRVKKFIASTSRFLVFEQNVPQTRNRFLNIVRPFLNQVQQQNGLFAFRVKMDADNNPPEVIDRNKLVGEIFLQPTRTAEFIELTFNVLPTGAEFEDV